jgi:hypothetical protein
VIRPHSPSDVMAEFKSPRMRWSGEFHRYMPGALRRPTTRPSQIGH